MEPGVFVLIILGVILAALMGWTVATRGQERAREWEASPQDTPMTPAGTSRRSPAWLARIMGAIIGFVAGCVMGLIYWCVITGPAGAIAGGMAGYSAGAGQFVCLGRC